MPGRAFGYTRVSPCERDIEPSMQAQADIIERYYEYRLKPLGITFEGVFEDRLESAWKKVFAQRPAGADLNVKLQAGDHVIFSRLDRGFRLGRDLLNMHAAWSDRGVTLHFADMQLDTSTAVGKVFMTVAVAFAEWYSAALSERMKASNEWRRKVGGAMNIARTGYKRVRVNGKVGWREDPDPEKIAVMQEIARLREVEKKTWPVIMKEIETKLWHAEGNLHYKFNAFSKKKIGTQPEYTRTYQAVCRMHEEGVIVLPWRAPPEPKQDEQQ